MTIPTNKTIEAIAEKMKFGATLTMAARASGIPRHIA